MKYSDLVCPDCGAQDHMLFDASLLREREFEGVYFAVTPGPNDEITVQGRAEDADYLDDYNMPKLCKEAVEVIEDEVFAFILCPKCREPLE